MKFGILEIPRILVCLGEDGENRGGSCSSNVDMKEKGMRKDYESTT